MVDKPSTPGETGSLKDVKIVRKRLADGTERVYRYHRHTGLPIVGEPGTRDFERSKAAAARGAPLAAAKARDLEWLVEAYWKSPEWAALSRATRVHRDSYLKRVAAWFGWNAPLAMFEDERIVSALYEWRDGMVTQPFSANHCLDTLSVLFRWAQSRRHMRKNWTADIKRLETKSRAEKTWSIDLWQRLMAAARPDERELLLFALMSGARQDDIAAMRASQFDGKWLVFTPTKTARKTGIQVTIPVYAFPPLARLLDQRSRTTEFLLCTARGQPWTTSNIKLRMRDLKARAFPEGDPDRTFHDIRGTLASCLMEASCTGAEIASVMGWIMGSKSAGEHIPMMRNYVHRSRQLALNAYQRWYAHDWGQTGNVVPIRAIVGAATEIDNFPQPNNRMGRKLIPIDCGIPE